MVPVCYDHNTVCSPLARYRGGTSVLQWALADTLNHHPALFPDKATVGYIIILPPPPQAYDQVSCLKYQGCLAISTPF